MLRFVCTACGSQHFDIEPEPLGDDWCRFVSSCHDCGADALVTGTNDHGLLRLRCTGPILLLTPAGREPGPVVRCTSNDCPSKWIH